MPQNWIDIAIIVVVAWNVANGVRRGFVGSLIDLAGFLLSLAISITAYVQVADWAAAEWSIPGLVAQPLAFAALWAATSLVVAIVGHIVGAPFFLLLRGSPFDLLLSTVPSALKGLAVSGFLLTLALSIPPPPAILPGGALITQLHEAMTGSALAQPLVERSAAFDRFAREVVGEPLSQTLTLLTVRPGTSEVLDLNFKVENPTLDAAAESQMLTLLNQERAKAGLKPLERDPVLDTVARAQAQDMLRRGYFGHDTPEGTTPFDRIREAGVDFAAAGENLALAPTTTLAHQGLMDSPGHRANILNSNFQHVGIGVARADGRGRMFTEDFTN